MNGKHLKANRKRVQTRMRRTPLCMCVHARQNVFPPIWAFIYPFIFMTRCAPSDHSSHIREFVQVRNTTPACRILHSGLPTIWCCLSHRYRPYVTFTNKLCLTFVSSINHSSLKTTIDVACGVHPHTCSIVLPLP